MSINQRPPYPTTCTKSPYKLKFDKREKKKTACIEENYRSVDEIKWAKLKPSLNSSLQNLYHLYFHKQSSFLNNTPVASSLKVKMYLKTNKKALITA